MSNSASVENFRKYIQIPTVHPEVNYAACVSFLECMAKELDLPVQVYRIFPDKPVVVITFLGQEPNLPSILLNGHMDVVPVVESEWTYKPFGAEIDEKGNIYGRGTQDMKSVSIQYLEAIRKLKQDGVTLRRTVHVIFVPDEEIGGACGMAAFSKSDYFKNLNVGFAFDEGAASPNDEYHLFYSERAVWNMRVHFEGEPGHSCFLMDKTPGEKLEIFLHKFFEFRRQETDKLKNDPSVTLGDVTTVNLTMLQGGQQANIVPSEFVITIGCRLPTTVNLEEWENTLQSWCKEAGEKVWVEFVNKDPHSGETKLDDSNLFWVAFKKAVKELNIKINPQRCPGSSDIRFLRILGIPAIGFSPMSNTTPLLHRENEYLNVNEFLKGIDIYYKLIQACASV